MNYQWHYESLISRGKTRSTTPDVYYERHHIIPRCMGGSDDVANLVNLTPEEHVVAHLLLAKLYPLKSELLYAIHVIYGSNTKLGFIVKNNKNYGWVKRRLAKLNSERMKGNTFNRGKVRSEETKRKISESNRGRKLSDATRERMSLSKTGRTHSEESKKKMSDAKKGKQPRGTGFTITESMKEAVRKAQTGRVRTAEQRKQQGIRAKEQAALRKEMGISSPLKGKPWSDARRIAHENKKVIK